MFHTFQSSISLRLPSKDINSSGKPSRPLGLRRTCISNACVECRRRKIRCDGSQPCGQCQWYERPKACSYLKLAQRVSPHSKLVDKLSNDIEQYKTVFTKLFGGRSLESLVFLTREELLQLALSPPTIPRTTTPSAADSQASLSDTSAGFDGDETSERLEHDPSEYVYWDEAWKHQLCGHSMPHDANGLSMSMDDLSPSITVTLPIPRSFQPGAMDMDMSTPFSSADSVAIESNASVPISATPNYMQQRLYSLPNIEYAVSNGAAPLINQDVKTLGV